MGSRHQPATCTYVCYPIRIPFQSPDLARMPSSLASNHYLQSPEVLKKVHIWIDVFASYTVFRTWRDYVTPPPPGCAFKIKLSPCRTESKKKEQVWLPSCLGVWLASICYFFHAVGMWMSQIWEIPSRWVVGMVGICVGPPSVWDHITMSDTAFVLVICQWENSLHSFFFYYFFF